MNYTLIILGILLVVVIYILYKVISEKGKSVTNKLNSVDTNPTWSYASASQPGSSRYYLSWWIYVVQQNSGTDLFAVQDASDTKKVKLNLDSSGKMTFTIKDKAGNASVNYHDHVLATNFPYQKWVYCVLSVDNNVVDVYIDGKMVRSQRLNYKPDHPDKDDAIHFAKTASTDEFHLAKVERVPQPMDPSMAWNKYMEGNGGSYFSRILSNYGATFTITKDDLDIRSFDLL